MPTITCADRCIETGGGSVLDSLERAGIQIPNSCRSGHCQSCVVHLKSGETKPLAQLGLNLRQRRLNYFLACQYQPDTDIEVELLDDRQRRRATLLEKTVLNERVMRIRLQAPIDWRAGQYLTLWRNGASGRIYSIASLPEDGYIELHLRRRNGLVSGWIENELVPGDECEIGLPQGDCHYSPTMPGQPLVLVGSGTGLAPVYGVLRQALADGHHGTITLYACAGEPDTLYLQGQLRRLAGTHPGLSVVPVVRRNPQQHGDVVTAELEELLEQRHPRLRGSLIYLCGPPGMVARLREQCFMQGAHYSDIFFDSFEPFENGK
ncbi:2Fe-2S iron-sulfur cluster-binding protein [Haliea sp. E17]|uniref:2Fe-2S iron-sulfur cluster-binding protein n=1 Tax=Haliea sp. E17 TaxID=3401576 RepID=UPI003AAD71FF